MPLPSRAGAETGVTSSVFPSVDRSHRVQPPAFSRVLFVQTAKASRAVTMNRDAKTQSALIALARTRRMQRALAHAYLHRGAPMPTLRHSLGYMTTTACVADDGASRGHQMTVLGVARAEG